MVCRYFAIRMIILTTESESDLLQKISPELLDIIWLVTARKTAYMLTNTSPGLWQHCNSVIFL